MNGLSNIKKEIQLLEKVQDQNKIQNYLNNLIDFAGNAIEEVEEVNKLFDQTKTNFIEIAEKFGEKKTAKPKDVFEPLYNFFKYF